LENHLKEAVDEEIIHTIYEEIAALNDSLRFMQIS